MRVIAGSARGVPLKAPKGDNTRPTTDRVRESLFAILGDLTGSRVLDSFAGSGALGIEALSRGANAGVFLEKNRQAVKVIHENLAKTRLRERATVLPIDTIRFLARPERYLPLEHSKGYDLVFVDPPYESGLYNPVMSGLAESGLLMPSGVVVVEQSFKSVVLPELAGFILRRSERYGDTILSFYGLADAGACQ